jgi:DNA-binding CsgD family transcriptional regulator
MGYGLAGRSPERSALGRLLDAGAGVALVSGQAGIGKSALLAWLAEGARARGWQVLRAIPAEAERGLPFAGLADLLGPHLRGLRTELPEPLARALDAALLRADPSPGGRADLAVRLGAHAALESLSRGGRCLVIVDDVPWLDLPTAQALGFALRRLDDQGPVVVFGSRTGAAVPGVLGSLLAARRAVEVPLGPLGVDELAEIVTARLAVPLPDPAARALHQAAGGNPLFALELARGLPGRRLPEAGSAPPPVPAVLRELLRARMGSLSAPARRGLLLVAAAGRLHTSDLASLLGPRAAASCMAESADADVLHAEADGTLRFSHPLLAGLAYADAPASQRRAAHARLAELAGDPEHRARHLAASLTLPDAATAGALDEASRLAAARGAAQTAAEFAERARQLTPAGDGERGWDRGLVAAQWYGAADAPEPATRLLRELAESAPTRSHQARALIVLASHGNDEVRSRALAEQALALAGEDMPVAALARGWLGQILLNTGDTVGAEREAGRAAELARAAGDADAELHALLTLVVLGIYAGTPDLSPLLAAQRAAAARAPAARGYLHPATWAGLVCLYRDEPAAARAHFLAVLADAERAGDYDAAGSALRNLTRAEVLDGNLAAAADAAARFRRWHPYGDDGPVLSVVALPAAYLGDAETAADAATRGAEIARNHNDANFTVHNLCVLGFVEASRGRFAAALPALREARAITRRMGVRDAGVYRWHAEHIEASLAAGCAGEAAQIAAELRAQAETLGRPGLRALAGRCTGLVEAATGDVHQGLSTLTIAAGRAGAELPFEHARTLLALGTVARRARRKAEARDALTSACTYFTTIGAELWAQRAAEELRRVGLRTAPGTLTETERRIAELVVSGRTNREVAAEVFLTVKTVEANLSRIYHKLHVRSRTQLAHALAHSPEP